jgi:hypothetical protein
MFGGLCGMLAVPENSVSAQCAGTAAAVKPLPHPPRFSPVMTALLPIPVIHQGRLSIKTGLYKR